MSEAAALHPADELAYLRSQIAEAVMAQAVLARREEALAAVIMADREQRVGVLHHAVVSRVRGIDCVDIERLPDLAETLRLLSGPLLCIDCETTGLHPLEGDRIVSLAVLSVRLGPVPRLDHPWSPSRVAVEDGVQFHPEHAWIAAFDPEGRRSSPEAMAVHGLSDERLAAASPFAHYARELDDILTRYEDEEGKPTLVAHNAPFDVGFLDMEFEWAGHALVLDVVVDTRVLSKMLWPGEPGSLDALCSRLGIDRGDRDARHESLKDARLLALCLPGLVAEIRRRLGR